MGIDIFELMPYRFCSKVIYFQRIDQKMSVLFSLTILYLEKSTIESQTSVTVGIQIHYVCLEILDVWFIIKYQTNLHMKVNALNCANLCGDNKYFVEFKQKYSLVEYS